jgi:hypothetical protein
MIKKPLVAVLAPAKRIFVPPRRGEVLFPYKGKYAPPPDEPAAKRPRPASAVDETTTGSYL